MFSIKQVPFLLVLFITLARASTCVKSLIFNNTDNSVTIEFSESVIFENIFLMKKTKEEDICVPVSSLNESLISPAKYHENLEKYRNCDFESKKYKQYKSRVLITRCDVQLDPQVFDEKGVYLFKISLPEDDTSLYSEEFVYNEKGFEHKCASDNHRWYASSWPWIAIGFIILTAILIIKIAFF